MARANPDGIPQADEIAVSGSYKVLRKIAPDLQITYLIAKPLGRNFIEIDQDLTTFINQHLEPTK